MGDPARRGGATVADFWAFEGKPGTRYELFDGEIVAMNQPTVRHAVLQASLITELNRALDGRASNFDERAARDLGVALEKDESVDAHGSFDAYVLRRFKTERDFRSWGV